MRHGNHHSDGHHNGSASKNRLNNGETGGEWGLCKDCKWWQIEPGARIAATTAGYCIDEKLQPFQLRITGAGGCNRFMEGTPARGSGSSAKPPTAVPAR